MTSTRKNLGLLLLVLLATVLTARFLPPDEPLRSGMTEAEVDGVLGEKKFWFLPDSDCSRKCSPFLETAMYTPEPEFVGGRYCLYADFDEAGRLTNWRREPLSRTRPPWLDRTLKWAGW